MYEQNLIQAGLSGDQAKIYEILLTNGPSPASTVKQKSDLSRPMVYKVLGQLQALSLVEKKEEKGAVATFCTIHPLKLQEMVEQKKRAAEGAAQALEGVIAELTSQYNLAVGKPGVRFYEGFAGIVRVLEDSLSAKKEIYSYADLESIDAYIPEINKEYVKKRERRGIKKKGIVLDTPFARQFLKGYYPGITETRLIKTETPPFETVMQIYDNKISYITLSDTNIIGVIIEDRRIYAMHKHLFDYLWERAETPASEIKSLENET